MFYEFVRYVYIKYFKFKILRNKGNEEKSEDGGGVLFMFKFNLLQIYFFLIKKFGNEVF